MESQPPNHNGQGSLFDEHTTPSGATDPELQKYETTYTPVEGGVYPETSEQLPQDAPQDNEASEATTEAVKTENRSKAQRYNHSPLERTGSYSEDLRLGDYLPGFGPVTGANYQKAQEHAAKLDKKRNNSKGNVSNIFGPGESINTSNHPSNPDWRPED